MALYGEPVVVVSDPRLTPVMVSTVATVYAELQPQVKDEKGTDAQEKVYALGMRVSDAPEGTWNEYRNQSEQCHPHR